MKRLLHRARDANHMLMCIVSIYRIRLHNDCAEFVSICILQNNLLISRFLSINSTSDGVTPHAMQQCSSEALCRRPIYYYIPVGAGDFQLHALDNEALSGLYISAPLHTHRRWRRSTLTIDHVDSRLRWPRSDVLPITRQSMLAPREPLYIYIYIYIYYCRSTQFACYSSSSFVYIDTSVRMTCSRLITQTSRCTCVCVREHLL